MRVLVALDYYRPNVSGLSITAQDLARGLGERGHRITVLTHRHLPDLPTEEQDGPVRILRAPVLARAGKAQISPALVSIARREIRRSDLLHLHAPLTPAVPLAWLARRHRVPILTNYHCDLRLPRGFLQRAVEGIARKSQNFALDSSAVIVNSTEDYARHTPALARRLDRFVGIFPPVLDPAPSPVSADELRARWGVHGNPVILFVGRFAAEKGLPELIEALPAVRRAFPQAVLLLAGERHAVPGESVGQALARLLDDPHSGVVATGFVPDAWMPALFEIGTLLALPSTNSTESFGMIQVEAMLAGLPVVASDLPGVRQPVRLTGMGEAAPPRDAAALARAILKVLSDPDAYRKPRAAVREIFSPEKTFAMYMDAYARAARRDP
ncbi:MAG TPA: glycosyltransferase family 4 protein [Thermoanaerobaculia bacterium]|nr:glycosyltransferase family 4 protein [Thermoanaerobaculia bacterium]